MVQPETITLSGMRNRQQVVITGRYADGSIRDLTPFCDLSLEAANTAQAESGGYIVPRRDGATTLLVHAGGRTARIPVMVKDLDRHQPISFRHEFIAALNVGGCNQARLPRHAERQEWISLEPSGVRSGRGLSPADA